MSFKEAGVKDFRVKEEALMANGKFAGPEDVVEIEGRCWCPACAKVKQGGEMS